MFLIWLQVLDKERGGVVNNGLLLHALHSVEKSVRLLSLL